MNLKPGGGGHDRWVLVEFGRPARVGGKSSQKQKKSKPGNP